MNCNFEVGSAIASSKIPKSVEFYNKYKRIYGKEIQAGHSPAPAYESVYILAEAIERADSIDPDAIVAELKKTDRMGIMGRIRYSESNQVVYGFDPKETALAAIFQWQSDGSRKIVFPTSIAEAKIKLPAGLKSMK